MMSEHNSKYEKVLLAIAILLLFIGGGFAFLKMVIKVNAPTVPVVSSWESIKEAISNCQAERIFQSHSLDVSARLKDGREIEAVEPKIDDIMKIAADAEGKCGRIIMATE